MSKTIKKKNYYKLFTDYCRKKNIWVAINTFNQIDYVTFTDFDKDSNPYAGITFGTKKAYEWLVKEHKEILKGDK
jgi:hypothetical protein